MAFQCAVARTDWEQVRERFYEVFRPSAGSETAPFGAETGAEGWVFPWISTSFHGFSMVLRGVSCVSSAPRGFQRVAYRRANGGTSAPSITEDAEPRFVARKRERPEIQLVVRKTFLELPEQPKAALKRQRNRAEMAFRMEKWVGRRGFRAVRAAVRVAEELVRSWSEDRLAPGVAREMCGAVLRCFTDCIVTSVQIRGRFTAVSSPSHAISLQTEV